MTMKDKLYRNNHKGVYYKARRFMLTFSLVVGFGTMISVPTYIATTQISKDTIAEEVNDVEETTEENSNEELLEFENI